mmetsp:Transcript_44926/g.66089  ORF Transcript_44926/g.66089 Transcript_44926/m.66089 type:complete len:425 (+) Transcript_44926:111-1385(+)|eukprot:CAMPEP_0195523816 /NCGR_PEP_ID=MMETSP0794_2-20130614/23256_1 /TAXON_ID=515487 /ORGANISM="Stephanopyxis turris, Strain CCMP 815" /LENGTH=424 /DNA_ID=CAMNT_0040653895 /DNA_START=108 /DNA_END=1382 /DNA_ORIENTATION=-
MDWTQKQLASIFPHITGISSWLGSFSIVVDVIRKHRRELWSNSAAKVMPYHRLMMGMSICDLCSSSAWMLSTWPVSADEPNVFDAHGTEASCKTQAFFLQLGIGTPCYNLALAIYYYQIIAKSSMTTKLQERIMHFCCLGFAISTAVASLALDLFGFAGFWCWIEGKHHLYRWLFWYGPLWTIIIIVTSIMVVITIVVKKQENRQSRWSTFHRSYRVTFIGYLRNLRKSKNEGDDRASGGTTTHQSPDSRNNASRTKISDSVKWQAFWYVLSFFATWVFLTAVRAMQTVGKGGEIPYWVVLMAVTLTPSQGLFNFLVYLRPRYRQHRKKHPDVGRFITFVRIHPFVINTKWGERLTKQKAGSLVSLIFSNRHSSATERRKNSQENIIKEPPNENNDDDYKSQEEAVVILSEEDPESCNDFEINK